MDEGTPASRVTENAACTDPSSRVHNEDHGGLGYCSRWGGCLLAGGSGFNRQRPEFSRRRP